MRPAVSVLGDVWPDRPELAIFRADPSQGQHP